MRILLAGVFLFFHLVIADNKISKFEDVDSDDDGQISFSEFEKSQKAMTPQPPESTIMAVFNASDLDGNHQLSPDEYRTLLSNLRADGVTQAEEIFKMLDTNSDGQLSLEEAEKAAKMHNLPLSSIIEGVFKLTDTNNDGVLSLDEFKEFSSKNVGEKAGSGAENIGSTTPGTILGTVDTNGDGDISLPELRVFAVQFEDMNTEKADALFHSIDANKDGQIDGDELIPLHAKLAEMIRSPIPGGVIPNASKLT